MNKFDKFETEDAPNSLNKDMNHQYNSDIYASKPVISHFKDDVKEGEALRKSPTYRDIDEEIKQRFTTSKNQQDKAA